MSHIPIEIKLSHALLKGSHEFVQSAVKYANDNEEISWRFAALHLASSIELLLKSKLAEEHWSLVFANPDKASIDNLQTGDFQSVDIATLQKRLNNICGIELPNRDKELIKKLRKIRNKIIHFHITISKNSIKSITAESLNTYIEFHNKHIAPNWVDYSDIGYELSQKLTEFREFLTTRLGSLSNVLSNSNRPKTNYFWECARCLQDATVCIDDNNVKCLFCGEVQDIADLAEFYSENEIVESCPSCGIQSYVVTSTKNDKKNLECIICGSFVGSPQQWANIDGNQLPHIRTFDTS